VSEYRGPEVTGALKKGKGSTVLCQRGVTVGEKELGHWEITEGAIFA